MNQLHESLRVSGLDITGRSGAIVSGVDITVAPGETVGIVGESGSGKSMTVRGIMGILPDGVHAHGSVMYKGAELIGTRPGHRRHSDFAMVFQDPFTMLNPLMRVGRHISESLTDGRGRRLRGKAAREQEIERLAEVGIKDPAVAGRLPYELSGGMRQRVGIAATLSSDPTLLIADEATTALDVTTQAEILALLGRLQAERGMGLMLITHDLGVAAQMCDRIYVMYAGRLIEAGTTHEVIERPMHPYTRGLIDSNPPSDRRLDVLPSMPGSVPRASEVLDTCPFVDRCDFATDVCRSPVALAEHADSRLTACVRIDDIAGALAGPGKTTTATSAEPAARAGHDDAEAASADAQSDRSAGARAGATSGAGPVIEIDGLRKVFGQKVALDSVSLQLNEGECVGIVGESGSGKTTIGRCIVGLEQPTGGTITVDGLDASDYDNLGRRDIDRLRSTVQMAFQDPYSTLSPARSIGTVLEEAIRLDDQAVAGASEPMKQRVAKLLELVGLPTAYAARKPRSLSGGERQRVALARALARRPKAIVCDEIVSALDVSVQAQILNLLKRLKDRLGISLLFITHDLAVVRQVTDRVYVVKNGRIVESGPTDGLLDNPQEPYTQELLASIPGVGASA